MYPKWRLVIWVWECPLNLDIMKNSYSWAAFANKSKSEKWHSSQLRKYKQHLYLNCSNIFFSWGLQSGPNLKLLFDILFSMESIRKLLSTRNLGQGSLENLTASHLKILLAPSVQSTKTACFVSSWRPLVL